MLGDLDEKFLISGQDCVKLQIALKRFFMPNCLEEGISKKYEEYLKRRIRPAMETLIESEDTHKMELLISRGWVLPEMVDGFIQMASEKQKMESLLFLMNIKQNRYSFKDKDYSL